MSPDEVFDGGVWADADVQRAKAPVTETEPGQWTLYRHGDVFRAVTDHVTFGSAVSRHVAIPNGMDPPEHTKYRRIIDPYFSRDRIAGLEPVYRELAASLAGPLSQQADMDFMAAFSRPFSVQAQLAFLDWPADIGDALLDWTQRNQDATRSRDRALMKQIADEFEGYVARMLDVARAHEDPSREDVVSRLLRERVDGQPLDDARIVSILRNWTVGEIGTIAASIGIVVGFLAKRLDVQGRLREDPALVPSAIDEILRIYGPLASNRRITTCPVVVGGQKIPEGHRVHINWIAANRDGGVFESPTAFRLDRDPKKNLLYGAGIHYCPGAPLARMELRVALEELLCRTHSIECLSGCAPEPALPPTGGFRVLRLRFR